MKYRPLGILVLGHTREKHLRHNLESLAKQGALGITHVWLDGDGGRLEWGDKLAPCRKLIERFPVAEWRAHFGHLGIEKLMLNGLRAMASRYEKIIVLEDDCFPTRRAVATFNQELDAIAETPNVFSIYGHHFLTPSEGDTITRFQGWGWATTRDKLLPILDQVIECFLMSEQDYLSWVQNQLTDEIRQRLNITERRNVLNVLAHQFSWDSCTCLLTAKAGLVHKKTPVRTIYNCGFGQDSGHFPANPEYREPPWNMILPDEVWDYFDQ